MGAVTVGGDDPVASVDREITIMIASEMRLVWCFLSSTDAIVICGLNRAENPWPPGIPSKGSIENRLENRKGV